MTEQFTNAAISTLVTALDAVTDPVSVVVQTGHGSKYPGTGDFHFWIDEEIFLGTARTSDTITASRAQEGSVIAAHSAGAFVVHGPTALSHQLHTHSGVTLAPDNVEVTDNIGFSSTGLAQRCLYTNIVLASDNVLAGHLLQANSGTPGRAELTTLTTNRCIGVALDPGNIGDTIRMAIFGIVQIRVGSGVTTSVGGSISTQTGAGLGSGPNQTLSYGSGRSLVGAYIEASAAGSERNVWAFFNPSFNMAASATGTPLAITPDGSPAVGSGAGFANMIHEHGIVTYASIPPAVGVSGSAGTSGTAPARGDHTHSGTVSAVTEFEIGPFSMGGVVGVFTGQFRLYVRQATTILYTRASLGTAPTGASVVVDLKKNGTTTIFNTTGDRPTIAVSTNTDEGGTLHATNKLLAANDFLTMDIISVGSGEPGRDLTVQIWAQPT